MTVSAESSTSWIPPAFACSNNVLIFSFRIVAVSGGMELPAISGANLTVFPFLAETGGNFRDSLMVSGWLLLTIDQKSGSAGKVRSRRRIDGVSTCLRILGDCSENRGKDILHLFPGSRFVNDNREFLL